MKALIIICEGKSAALISVDDVSKNIPRKKAGATDFSRIEVALSSLEKDGYLSAIASDRNGTNIYCISLSSKGAAYAREREREKRYLLYRIVLSLLLAVGSFLVGVILRLLFKS